MQQHRTYVETPSSHALAHLITESWLDPTLGERYSRNPRSVLEEFGIALGARAEPPTLPPPPSDVYVVESLMGRQSDGGVVASSYLTFCNTLTGAEQP